MSIDQFFSPSSTVLMVRYQQFCPKYQKWNIWCCSWLIKKYIKSKKSSSVTQLWGSLERDSFDPDFFGSSDPLNRITFYFSNDSKSTIDILILKLYPMAEIILNAKYTYLKEMNRKIFKPEFGEWCFYFWRQTCFITQSIPEQILASNWTTVTSYPHSST